MPRWRSSSVRTGTDERRFLVLPDVLAVVLFYPCRSIRISRSIQLFCAS